VSYSAARCTWAQATKSPTTAAPTNAGPRLRPLRLRRRQALRRLRQRAGRSQDQAARTSWWASPRRSAPVSRSRRTTCRTRAAFGSSSCCRRLQVLPVQAHQRLRGARQRQQGAGRHQQVRLRPRRVPQLLMNER
jgi:hypothetical protein